MSNIKSSKKAQYFALKVFIFILMIGLIMGGYLDFTRFYENKIFPNVSIASISIGGKSKIEAEKIISREMAKINQQGLNLSYNSHKFNPKLSDLGINIETQDMVDKAFLFGRHGTIVTRAKENFELLSRGYNLPIIISINQSKTNDFIDSIASKIEIEVVDRKVAESTAEILDNGRDGLDIDKTKLIDNIKNQLTSGNINVTITIPTTIIPMGEQTIKTVFAPGDYYGRYIDINLTEQKMTLFDNNKIVNEYPVSTGKWSTPTPIGIRYIQNKNARAWSPKYGLYMPYWNSIGNGYGIHELPEWPNGYKEGEAHLGTPVSHGCIRLGVDPAEIVYNWAPVGTPVYIHK